MNMQDHHLPTRRQRQKLDSPRVLGISVLEQDLVPDKSPALRELAIFLDHRQRRVAFVEQRILLHLGSADELSRPGVPQGPARAEVAPRYQDLPRRGGGTLGHGTGWSRGVRR